jgi:glucose-1-phosphate adenylyltransferase
MSPQGKGTTSIRALDNILTVIMGGGRGSRLYPLTKQRSKPAVPIAGKYRLIDIPISNSINSGIYHIAVLTQFNSVSLHRHITHAYNFDVFHKGWVQIWAAEQTIASADWYQGNADAVRKQLFEIRAANTPYVLILAGDHLYRMDYAAMAHFHWDNKADITIAVQPVATQDTGRYGILKRDDDFRITDFAEKPREPSVLQKMKSRPEPARPFLGSMGIYLFNTDVLFDLLESTTFDDFGSHVIPYALKNHAVFGYDFDGYWEDIGTIRSFYDTNMALTNPDPPFSFFDPERPIYTNPRFLPGSTIENSTMENVLIAEGCRIRSSEIRHSIVGVRSQIGSGSRIIDSILMGADFYDNPSEQGTDRPKLGIGSNCQIEGAIIDKNTRLGDGVIIRPFPRGTDLDNESWTVQDGIVVIPKNAVLPSHTTIAPI